MEPTPDASSTAYDGLAAVDVEWLKQSVASLRLKLRNTVGDIFETGSILNKAKRRLGSKWKLWLREEAQLSQRQAGRLQAVAEVFAKVPAPLLERFTPTALYNLADSGVPQSLREYSIEFAQDNENGQITATMVDEWLGAYRENPVAPLKLAKPDEPVDVDPNEVYAGDNWKLLDKLIGTDGSVHLAATKDMDEQITDRTVVGIYTNLRGERRTATHASLERVVLTLCGVKREKECRKCKETKSLDEFSVRKDQEGGRNNYCLACERKRVKKYEQQKRDRAKAAKTKKAA